ncbi:hypothetical protein L3Q82_025773, partial [Scortum barcoo]
MVSACSSVSGMETPSCSPQNRSMHQHSVSFTAGPTDPSLLGSYRPRTAK